MGTLDMTSIFRCMMEDGYNPVYEKNHIIFAIDDNLAIVEYEEGVLSVRLFFSIEEEAYDLFLEAGNQTMLKAFIVKPVLLDDMTNLMFSCEILCDNLREFKKFFPRCIELIHEALYQHKSEMKKLIPATDKILPAAGKSKVHKVVS